MCVLSTTFPNAPAHPPPILFDRSLNERLKKGLTSAFNYQLRRDKNGQAVIDKTIPSIFIIIKQSILAMWVCPTQNTGR